VHEETIVLYRSEGKIQQKTFRKEGTNVLPTFKNVGDNEQFITWERGECAN
jgi:hypothetical protein